MTQRMYQGENDVLDAAAKLSNLAELLTAVAHQKKGIERNAYIEAAAHVRDAKDKLIEAHVSLGDESLAW